MGTNIHPPAHVARHHVWLNRRRDGHLRTQLRTDLPRDFLGETGSVRRLRLSVILTVFAVRVGSDKPVAPQVGTYVIETADMRLELEDMWRSAGVGSLGTAAHRGPDPTRYGAPSGARKTPEKSLLVLERARAQRERRRLNGVAG